MSEKIKKMKLLFSVGLLCFLFGTLTGFFFSHWGSPNSKTSLQQDQIPFLLNFVPLYEQTSQQPTSENLARLEKTLEPFLFDLFKKNLSKESMVKTVPLEIHRILGVNPYQVLIEKLGTSRQLQDWMISVQTDDQQKVVSQITIQEVKELLPVGQLSLWEDQVLILRGPCPLASASIHAEHLEIDLDPFSLNQVLIRWKKAADDQSRAGTSFQFECLDRVFRFTAAPAQEASQHTRFLSVPLSFGEFIRTKNPSITEKALENELGLDLEEGR